MTPTLITYQRVFPLGSYSTERIGLEATLDEGENPETALSRLKIMVEELHQETLKSLSTDDFRGTHVRNVVEEPVDSVNKVLEAIRLCNEIEGNGEFSLRTYWLISKGNLVLSQAYKEREKQLTDAK